MDISAETEVSVQSILHISSQRLVLFIGIRIRCVHELVS